MRRPLFIGCLAVILFMSFYFLVFPPDRWEFSELEGKTYLYTGQVYKRETIDFMEVQQSKIYLKNVSVYEKSTYKCIKNVSGIICYASGEAWPKIGSKVWIEGKFKNFQKATNPGEFDGAFYYQILKLSGEVKGARILKESKEYHKFEEMLNMVNAHFERRIESSFSEEAQGIMKTMILGNNKELDPEIKEGYKDAGILHLLSVSGLHISIVGYGVYKLLRKIGLGNWVSAFMGIGLILSYGIMIGMGISAFRAIFMFLVQMLGKCIGRTYDLLTALGLAGLILLLDQPLYLFHSGFQLSFGCVVSIAVFCPLIQKERKAETKGEKLMDAFLFSAGITIATLPVFLWFYYEVSLIGMFLNLIVIPLMSLIMYGGIGVLLLPQGLRIFQVPIVWMNELILKLYWWLCENGNQIPFSKVILGRPEGWQMIVYLLGILGLILFHKKIKYCYRWIIIAGLTLILIFPVPGEFQITFLDVGQGDGICLETKEGEVYLFDGGSSSKKNVGEKIMIPYLKFRGITRIEGIFLSHSDADHISGILELLQDGKGIAINTIYIPGIARESQQKEFRDIALLCAEKGVKLYSIYSGMTLRKGALEITCLNPPKEFAGESNAGSEVFYIQYHNFTGLFTGDVEGQGEELLMEQLKRKGLEKITLLKVAHHGSSNSTKTELLNILRPRMAVISCGKNNSYGHPHAELLERLEQEQTRIYRTDEEGAITVTVSPKKVVVEKWW